MTEKLTFEQETKRRALALETFTLVEDVTSNLHDDSWFRMTDDKRLIAQQMDRLDAFSEKFPKKSPAWGASYHYEVRLRLKRCLDTAMTFCASDAKSSKSDEWKFLELDLSDLREASLSFLRYSLPMGSGGLPGRLI